ncbi:MAG: hypothetical protein K2X01_05195 [Cyanobacteria bacterium]|nr:hypothetical protein [Cyanobacteriota bacterium]
MQIPFNPTLKTPIPKFSALSLADIQEKVTAGRPIAYSHPNPKGSALVPGNILSLITGIENQPQPMASGRAGAKHTGHSVTVTVDEYTVADNFTARRTNTGVKRPLGFPTHDVNTKLVGWEAPGQNPKLLKSDSGQVLTLIV